MPHGDVQEEAGQDQRESLRQGSANGSWQRSWSPALVSQVAGYYRRIASDLRDTPAAVPLFAESTRRHERLGILGSLAWQHDRHTVKAGLETAQLALHEDFTFAVTDEDEAEAAGISEGAIAYTLDDPFAFNDRVSRTQWSAYLQDSLRADRSGHARRRPALRQHAPAGGGHAVEPAARAGLRLAVHLDDAARVGQPLLSAAATRAPAALVVAGSPRPVAVRGRRRSRRRRGHARTRAPVGLGSRRGTVARRPGPRRPRRLVAVGGELRRPERVLRHHHRVPEQRRQRLGPRPRRAARAAARRRLVVVSHLHPVEGRTGRADQRRALPRGRHRRDRPGHDASRPITTSGIPPPAASPSSRATAAWSRR